MESPLPTPAVAELRSATDWWHRRGGVREVLNLSLPLVMSSLSLTLLTFVDRMFLMAWSQDALAASFPAGLLWWTLLCCPLGIAMYVGTFVSQHYGAGEYRRIGSFVWQGVWISVLASPLAMSPVLFAPALFRWAGHAPQVCDLEVIYFRILCLATPAMLVSTAFSSFYSGQGKTWVVMAVDMGSVVINIILDYAWIFGHAGFPAAGMAGGAWATFVAILFKVVIYVVLLSHPENRRRFGAWDWRPDGHSLRRLLKFGGPAGLQTLLEVAGFTIFVFLVGSLGVDELAATNLAFNVSSVAFMPVFGLSTAVSILVGQYLGRDDPDLAARGTWTSLWLATGYMLGISAMYLLIPDLFLYGFFTGESTPRGEKVRAIAIVLLRYVAAYNLFDALNMVFVSAIKGAGDTRFVFVTSFWMAVALGVATWLARNVFGAGLHGCWVLVTAWIWVLGMVYLSRFLQGSWRAMRVLESFPPRKTAGS